ncbi:DUF2512 family protein [Rubeoparvulum massiliense]|uniref:DUF2512 family protein n=1 Tax=Rubeoparvulum massiliense TaxID=1631346 RepID=UPI000977A931|nr:DUF2512 family protein [Rubeoparvulum massiliense]
MSSLMMKILICPIGVAVAGWLFPNVYYAGLYQPLVVGLLLAIAGFFLEYLVLRKGTLWISTVLDFIATALLVYLISNLFMDAVVSVFGAILTAGLLTVVEYFTHRWLIRTGRAEKSPAS